MFGNLLQFMSGHIFENYALIMDPFRVWLKHKGIIIQRGHSKEEDTFSKILDLESWDYCADRSKEIYNKYTLTVDLNEIYNVVHNHCKTDYLKEVTIVLMIFMLLNNYPDVPDIASFDFEFDHYDLIELDECDECKNKYKEYIKSIHDTRFMCDYPSTNEIQLETIILSLRSFQSNYGIDVSDLITYTKDMIQNTEECP